MKRSLKRLLIQISKGMKKGKAKVNLVKKMFDEDGNINPELKKLIKTAARKEALKLDQIIEEQKKKQQN